MENLNEFMEADDPVINIEKVDSDYQDDEFGYSTDEDIQQRLMENNIRFDSNDSLVIMSYKLPLSVSRTQNGDLILQESKSMVYPTIFNIKDTARINFRWIGWPGIITEDENEREKISHMLKKQNCYPIWLTADEVENYLLFHEQFLRPLFHNFKGTNERDME